ncbi:MAG TPA: DUF5671 domain-containing protein [Acidimicrobiia bacterium]|nr:DUF5671 domain-containing protein [Acidimicrobiia bacterium]
MSVLAVLLLLAVVLTVVILIQRSTGPKDEPGDQGADLVAYLILAIAVGVAGFALASLAATAFPGERFVFDPAEELANALSALVVSAPFAIYFWRRQARRRQAHPESAGWTFYLSLIELVFMTAFVIAAVMFINGLLTDEPASAWTGFVVFGAVLALHEYAAAKTPPSSEAGELQRVLGSAIALVTGAIGLAAVAVAILSEGYEALGGDSVAEGFHPWVAMLVVGAPIWWYRWLRPWRADPGMPRLTWTVFVSVISLTTVLASLTAIVLVCLQYVFADTRPAGEHFEVVPIALGLAIVGTPIWAVHRRALGEDAGDSTQVYRFAMAAIGLATAVGTATFLTIIAIDRTLIVGAGASEVIGVATALVAGLVVWLFFERKAGDADRDRQSWPRRIYTLGLGVVFALIAAGALIATIFVLLRRLLETGANGSLVEPISILAYTGLTAWYLLRAHQRSRERVEATKAIAPFEVMVICSHPGMIATRFPKEAKLKVVYRADDAGPIDDTMAEEIVAAVANRPALVWVDEEGFRVAAKRQ